MAETDECTFPLGRLVMTPGFRDAMLRTGQSPTRFLLRHSQGDWGELDDEDRRANDRAVLAGERLLSAYRLADGTAFWVVTEWDRSATTLLLPSEY
jgi:hypothetical protein